MLVIGFAGLCQAWVSLPPCTLVPVGMTLLEKNVTGKKWHRNKCHQKKNGTRNYDTYFQYRHSKIAQKNQLKCVKVLYLNLHFFPVFV